MFSDFPAASKFTVRCQRPLGFSNTPAWLFACLAACLHSSLSRSRRTWPDTCTLGRLHDAPEANAHAARHGRANAWMASVRSAELPSECPSHVAGAAPYDRDNPCSAIGCAGAGKAKSQGYAFGPLCCPPFSGCSRGGEISHRRACGPAHGGPLSGKPATPCAYGVLTGGSVFALVISAKERKPADEDGWLENRRKRLQPLQGRRMLQLLQAAGYETD